MTGTAAELTPIREVDDLHGRRRHARADHDRDPGDLRGRAARALRALRRLAGQGSRSGLLSMDQSSSTTPPCATGCRGRAMSLSVEEKVRVARILDDARRAHDRGRASRRRTRRSSSSSSACGEAGLRADVCAFGMTRRRGVAAEEDAALRVLAESWTPVSTIVGKTWGLHLEKVVKVDRDENLRMIAESVAFLVGERQARGLRRRALLRRLPRRRRRTRSSACAPRWTRAPRT